MLKNIDTAKSMIICSIWLYYELNKVFYGITNQCGLSVAMI